MHILGGKLKGKKLANCKSANIRPAMAVVRKSIFDTLKDFVLGINILDLCAGTGILGIEALSRGAKKLTVIDSSKDAIRLIRKNLDICKLNAKVISGKLPKVLNKISSNAEKYNLIFLDPPYGESGFLSNVLDILILNKILATDGLIIIESESRNNFQIPDKLEVCKEKRFGNTKLTYLQYIIPLCQ